MRSGPRSGLGDVKKKTAFSFDDAFRAQAREAAQRAQRAADREANAKAALVHQEEQVAALQAALREAAGQQQELSRQLHECQVCLGFGHVHHIIAP